MSYFKAESADIIGDVHIGQDASIWYHATLRGDVAEISIGERTNIQDNAVLHGSYGAPTIIGKDVTVGHGAIVHGCTIGDECLIGMGSIIIDGAEIGDHCIIGAGTLVTKGKKIPAGSMVFGNPMRIVRPLTEDEIQSIRRSSVEYMEFAKQLPMVEE